MNQLDLKGRVAVVTGGAQGIGYADGRAHAAIGRGVVLWDIDAPLLAKAKESLAPLGRVAVAPLELTDDAAVAKATRAGDRPSSAASTSWSTTPASPAATARPGNWRPRSGAACIEVNLVAPYLTCRAVVPQMLKQGYGRIVNVASVAGKEGNPNASHYSASKAGLIALTKSLGQGDWRPRACSSTPSRRPRPRPRSSRP